MEKFFVLYIPANLEIRREAIADLETAKAAADTLGKELKTDVYVMKPVYGLQANISLDPVTFQEAQEVDIS